MTLASERLPRWASDPKAALVELQACARDGERVWASADRRTLHVSIPVSPRLSGGRTRYVAADGRALAAAPRTDPALLKALRSAHAWTERLAAGEANPIANTYERRIIHLSCLAPEIQAAILAGEQPSGLTLRRLMTVDLPLDWGEQGAVLGRL